MAVGRRGETRHSFREAGDGTLFEEIDILHKTTMHICCAK
jgi:hypothetical protein